jgi:phytoene desaturase
MGMADIRQHIKVEHVVTPREWESDYNVYRGATFNLAHNLGQMIYLRPRNKFEELDHCYLVGGGTHPGSGLPTIYESGRIAANLICRGYGTPFVSGNLHV